MKIIILFTAALVAAAVGHIFYSMDRKKLFLFMPIPVILMSSHLFTIHVGPSLTASAVIWAAVSMRRIDSHSVKTLFPAFLCGLALHFDVRMFPVLIPVILSIVFFSRSERVKKVSIFLGLVPLSFLLLTPLSVYLAIPYQIIASVAPGGPDIDVFRYVFIIPFALWEGHRAWKNYKREFITALSFPLAMGIQGLFSENIPVSCWLPFVIALAACGVGEAAFAVRQKLARISFLSRPALSLSVTLLLFVTIITILFPVISSVKQAAALFQDNRHALTKYIRKNIAEGASIVCPEILEWNLSELSEKYHVVSLDDKNLFQSDLYLMEALLNHPIFIIPETRTWSLNREAQIRHGQWESIRGRFNAQLTLRGQPVYLDYYYSIPWGTPAITVGGLKRKIPSEGNIQEFNLWKRGSGKNRGLKTFSQLGEFEIEAADRHKRTISIRNLKSGKDDIRKITIGYLTDDIKSPLRTPAGQWVYVSVDLAIANASPSTECTLMLRDKDAGNNWETVSVAIPAETHWTTRIISKKIRPNGRFMLIGLTFSPISARESLQIRGFRTVFAPPPPNKPEAIIPHPTEKPKGDK